MNVQRQATNDNDDEDGGDDNYVKKANVSKNSKKNQDFDIMDDSFLEHQITDDDHEDDDEDEDNDIERQEQKRLLMDGSKKSRNFFKYEVFY